VNGDLKFEDMFSCFNTVHDFVRITGTRNHQKTGSSNRAQGAAKLQEVLITLLVLQINVSFQKQYRGL